MTGAHVDLHRWQDECRHCQCGVAGLAHLYESVTADALMHIPALFGLGLILFIITFVVLSASEWLIKQGERKAGGR